MAEKINTKPFNPLLGETFELKTDTFEFIAE
jgi:Oxysterol-binding protein